jgi:hypothetical protein
VGDRKPPYDSGDFLNLLYSGSAGMPSYRFLFERRQIGAGAQPSDNALKLTGALRPPAGWEIVPTKRAESLVGYLVNLKTTYTYPEAQPFVPPKAEGEAAKPASTTAIAPTPAPGINSAPAAAQAAEANPAPAPSPAPAPGAAVTPTPSTAPASPTPMPSAVTTSAAAEAPVTPTPSSTPPPASTPTPSPTGGAK